MHYAYNTYLYIKKTDDTSVRTTSNKCRIMFCVDKHYYYYYIAYTLIWHIILVCIPVFTYLSVVKIHA